MKFIKKKSVTPVNAITGSIVDTTNIDDKTTNTYSARVIDEMNTYSTEEQVIGTWIDGKPIYRNVFDFGALPNKDSSELVTGDLKIDNLITIRGFSKTDSYHILIPYNHSSSISSQVMIYYDITNKSIVIRTASDMSSYAKTYIVLEYTKTTD